MAGYMKVLAVSSLIMKCHLCQSEAVARCYNCGELVCEQHGKNDTCAGCSTAIVSGDPRADRISVKPKAFSQDQQHHGWWRPQQAEEYLPPACYECKGLTRAVCRNCQSSYCRDHAGPNGMCQACGRASWIGPVILGGMAIFMLLMLVWSWLFGA